MALSQPGASEQLMNRVIFCTYWLYFNAFRGVLGGMRLLDYLGMSFVGLGLINLLRTRLLNWKLVGWVTILLWPLALAAIVDPSTDTTIFVIKTYVVALYFVCYFKSERLTIVELVCFAVPVVVSVYFFLYPRPSDNWLLFQGRMSGLSEPNFTSLSLIISMCGALGVYVLTSMRRAKVAAIVVASVCCFGVILTASRAGFIGATIALCLFLAIEKKILYAGLGVVTVAIIMGLNEVGGFLNEFTVFQRFQGSFNGNNPAMSVISERSFTELAWHTVQSGKWFIGGGPQYVSEWSTNLRINVPHNSLLDIGVAFGKAGFYFYSALLVVLLIVNLRVVASNWRCRNQEEKGKLLAPMLFLSLLPMYMFLSAGLTMGFVLWMVLGAYPLLHATPKLAKAPSKKGIYRYVKV